VKPLMDRETRFAVLRIVGAYALFGVLWIFLSDSVVALFVQDPQVITGIAVFKGIAFIVLTATLLSYLIARYVCRLSAAQNQLKISEDRYRSILENMEEAYYEVDLEGRFTFFNQSIARTYGYTEDEIMGSSYTIAMDKENIDKVFNAFHQVYMTGDTIKGVDWKIRHKDGREIHVEASVSLLRDDEGNPVGFRGITRDITERKQYEAALRESEEQFRLAFSTSPDAININRLKDGLYIDINEGFTALTGFTKEEVIGRTSIDINIWYDPEDRKRLIHGLRATGSFENLEAQFRRKDGSVGTGLMSARVITLKGVEHIISVTRDITERRNAEKEKLRLEAQLAQAQKMESIGTLAGGIAHDFNNILSAIIGYTQLAQEDVLEPDKAKKELKEVLKAADRAKDLVSQILTFSRKGDATFTPVSLYKTILDSIKMMRSVLPTTIDIRHDLTHAGLVMADSTQIHQVLLNLCTNAAHAMDKTGGTLHISLVRADGAEDTRLVELNLPDLHYLKLSVSDTGHGMPPEVMARIFDPYFTTKEIGRGTGLGLAVVHGIVQSHGGSISCTSSPGKGTTFDIYLPEILAEEEIHGQHMDKTIPTGTEHILFVDDEPALVKLAESILKKLGYTVEARSSSTEALELFRKSPETYDLVITDMTMPYMTGDVLSQKIMEIRGDIPIILCSGYSDHISDEKAKKIGIREYILKPLEMKEMAKTIRTVLDS